MSQTLTSFCPKTKPFQHQLETWEATKDREFWALFAEQGLGKTKMTIDTADYLYQEGKIDNVLILAPNGVHMNWILREIPTHSHVPNLRAYWQGMTTKRETRKFATLNHTKGLFWYAMNIEAIRSERGAYYANNLVNHRTLLVIDESTVIKNPKAKQTKEAIELGKRAGYRRILSGTPIVQDPLDIWSQALFLSNEALPYRSWTAFKAKFAIEVQRKMANRTFNQVVGFRNLEQLKEEVGQWSTRLLKSECFELPVNAIPFETKPHGKPLSYNCFPQISRSLRNKASPPVKIIMVWFGFTCGVISSITRMKSAIGMSFLSD